MATIGCLPPLLLCLRRRFHRSSSLQLSVSSASSSSPLCPGWRMTQEQIIASPVCQKQIIESRVCQTFFDCHPRHPSSAASECHGEVALCCAAGESCQQLALQGKEWHSSYIFYILHHMNRQNMSSTPGDRIRRCCWSKLKKDQLPRGMSDGFESVSHSMLRTRCRTLCRTLACGIFRSPSVVRQAAA
jgi:hypothetical protein